ncbi:MAG: molybdopterin-dependent oxidoreductase [Candidatus Bathyarchaeia archaeon]
MGKINYLSSCLCGVSGSSLPMEAHVRNGKIVRVLPFHIPENVRLYEIKTDRGVFTRPRKHVPWTYMLAFKKRAFSPNRVMYPLKRIDWNPENRNPQNRGKAGFVRISWDEAIKIIVEEINRIKKVYGSTEPILVLADGHGQSGYLQTPHCWAHYLFDKLGSGWTLAVRNPDSWEGYFYGAKHVWGFDSSVGEPNQDAVWDDVLQNCEMLIFSGCDPETTVPGFSGQMGTYFCEYLKKAGIKIVGISPDLNYAVALHAEKWIPIKPNTDAALYLSIAYIWLKENSYDESYVKTHCVGFEEFKKYVLGEDDGTPKSPEWAEKICGTPSSTIKALARTWAKKRTSLAVHYGGPKIRGFMSHLPARLEAYLLAMQGLGKPGRQFLRIISTLPWLVSKKLPPIPQYPETFRKGIPPQPPTSTYMNEPPPDGKPFIIKTLIPEAILNPPVYWCGKNSIVCPSEDQFKTYRYPPYDGHPGIRMVWNENSCLTACWNHGYKMAEALKHPKIEFVVAVHPWLENDSLFADIILPAQTIFEHEDLVVVHDSDTYGIFYQEKSIDPVGESKSDYEIYRLIAINLGIGEHFPPVEEQLRKAYEATSASNNLPWEEFKMKKYYIYDAPSWDEWLKIKKDEMNFEKFEGGAAWFYKQGKGLETPTGKIEFVSHRILKHSPNDMERPPVAKWLSHGESPLAEKAENYPYLVVSNHPRWRHHSVCDDITWIREIPSCKVKGPDGYLYEPVWIHPKDAAEKSIKNGDIVMVYNDRGAVLCGAVVTERIAPGVLQIAHGSRLDLISIETKIDRGGCINLICPSPREKYEKGAVVKVPEMAVSSFLVDVKKADIERLVKEYPEAFARKIHPDVGQCCKTWIKR